MIKGQVARILSDSEIILNIGAKDGVKLDMKFVIYSEGDHILDPTTGEDLGAFEIVKGRVTIVHVMEKMSQAETSTYEVNVPSLYEEALRPSFLGSRRETRRDKLRVAQDQLKPLKDVYTVKVGDEVRSL